MPSFSISFSRSLAGPAAAEQLASGVEAELGGPHQVMGGLLWATSAAGRQGPEVGRLLTGRWPEAELLGTSFEGVVYDGRIWRDQPALALLAWGPGSREPVGFAIDPGEQDVERIADEILAAAGRSTLGPEDLMLLFPDALGPPAIDAILSSLEALLGRPSIAGASASGVAGDAPYGWQNEREWTQGGLTGVIMPDCGSGVGSASQIVSTAPGSRQASPWLEITACRTRWIDRLADVSALEQLRRHAGLEINREALEPYLGRLLVRLRRGPRPHEASRFAAEADHDEERYVVGVDSRRGAFSIPVRVERGDAIAFAWPDAELAREALETSLKELGDSASLLQFSCRARDVGLHGDIDIESAWVAARARGRRVLGTVAPFQIGPGVSKRAQMLVHASVLASLSDS